jgi:hypothetical protein
VSIVSAQWSVLKEAEIGNGSSDSQTGGSPNSDTDYSHTDGSSG